MKEVKGAFSLNNPLLGTVRPPENRKKNISETFAQAVCA